MARAFCLVLLSSLALGCTKDVVVTVRDGETGSPLDCGKVCVENSPIDELDNLFPWGPSCDRIVGGRAKVRWATHRGGSVSVTAPGYLGSATHTYNRRDGKRVARVELDFELFREPRPTVTLVVPAGHRGLLKFYFHDASEAAEAYPVGTREFAFKLKPGIINRFVYPPVLRHTSSREYRAAYDDGTPLPITHYQHGDHVALREVDTVKASDARGSIIMYCVGTVPEAREWRYQLRNLSGASMAEVEAFGR